jgi:putative aminopeptidase FrvX
VRVYAHAPAPLARQDHQLVYGEGAIGHHDRPWCTRPQVAALLPAGGEDASTGDAVSSRTGALLLESASTVAIPDLLRDLLTAAGPSGREEPAAAVWRSAASAFAEVHADTLGTSYARVGTGDRYTLAVIGHIDEIGFAVTHVGEDGMLAYSTLGGFSPEVLVGQRVVIAAREGPVEGVAMSRVRSSGEKGDRSAVSHDDLHIDIGATSGEEARSRVSPGDSGVWRGEPLELPNGRLVSRALDNRLGAYAALEVVRRVSEAGDAGVDVVAVASVQEETGHDGARAAAFRLEPDVAIVIDVTYATDVPGGDPTSAGRVELGSGAVVLRGPVANRWVSDALVDAADAEGIRYQIEVWASRTQTDADGVHASRAGVPTGIVSIPLRYMHSPCELVALDDLEGVVRLVAGFAARLTPGTNFVR